MRDEYTTIKIRRTDSITDFTKKLFSISLIFLILCSTLSIAQSRKNIEETDSYIIEFSSPSLISKMTDSFQDLNKTKLFQSSFLEKINENLLDHQSAIDKIRNEIKTDISLSSMHHFHFLFNGIKISNISQSDVNKIAVLPFVKRVQKDSMLSMQDIIITHSSESKPTQITKQDSISSENIASYSGDNISIAFFDSGIDYYHPALSAQYKGGYDFVNQDEDPFDDNGHGTHVIGITVAKEMKIKDDIIYSGIAPNASVFAYKVLDEQGKGYTSDFLSAFELAMDPNQDGNLSDHVDIISISAGNPDGNENDVLSTAAAQAVNAGICVVAAAGNNGPEENTIHSPAINASVIAVGAAINNDMLAAYSSRGSISYSTIKPDILAPGHEIVSTWPDNQSKTLSGTSMATPYISGLIACMLEKNGDLQPLEIKSILHTQTKQLGYGIFDEGYGLINTPDDFQINKYFPIQISTIQPKDSNSIKVYLNSSSTLSDIDYSITVSPTRSLHTILYQKNDNISQVNNEIIQLDLNTISSGFYVISINLCTNQSNAHIKKIMFFDHYDDLSAFPSTVIAGKTFSTTFETNAIHFFIVPFRSIQIDIGTNISFKAPKTFFTEKEYINATIITIPTTFPIQIEKHCIKILNSEAI